MSQPIKIVEAFIQSSDKNTNKFQPNQSNQKNNVSYFSSYQSSLVYCTKSSSSFNKYSDISSPSNISFIYNENSPQIKDSKVPEDESTMNLNETNTKKTRYNSIDGIIGEDTSEKKYVDYPEARPCFMSLEYENQNRNINSKYNENGNLLKEDLNEEIKKNNNFCNFNNCPNKNKKFRFNEIRNYFQEIKELSDKMIQNIELIYSKNELLLNSSNEINLNDSQKNIDIKNKKINNKEFLININNLNNSKDTKDKKSNINNISSPKLNINFIKKENKENQLLDANKKII